MIVAMGKCGGCGVGCGRVGDDEEVGGRADDAEVGIGRRRGSGVGGRARRG